MLYFATVTVGFALGFGGLGQGTRVTLVDHV